MSTEEKISDELLLPALANKFTEDALEWRIGRCGVTARGPWAQLLCYVTNRAIQDRLDAVVGPHRWQNQFVQWGSGNQLCGISIRCGDEWITKWDGAPNTDVEPVKGGLSDSMKRAAVQWGIGRYLYQLPETWADCVSEKRPGWRMAKTKDGKPFSWRPPSLKDIAPWALQDS